MALEVEVKVIFPGDVDPGSGIVEAAQELGLNKISQSVKNLTSIYYDTPDMSLLTLGAALRFRYDDEVQSGDVPELLQGGIWGLKTAVDMGVSNDLAVTREEFEVPGAAASPPKEFFGALNYLLDDPLTLTPVATISNRRLATVFGFGEGELLEVAHDRVSVRLPQEIDFQEVEVEAITPSASQQCLELAQKISALGGEVSEVSKLQRALGSPQADPFTDEENRLRLGLEIRLFRALESPVDQWLYKAFEFVSLFEPEWDDSDVPLEALGAAAYVSYTPSRKNDTGLLGVLVAQSLIDYEEGEPEAKLVEDSLPACTVEEIDRVLESVRGTPPSPSIQMWSNLLKKHRDLLERSLIAYRESYSVD